MNSYITNNLHIRPSQYQNGIDLFMRAVGLISLLQGISYWASLVGFYPVETLRFDLLPSYWQMTGGLLALMFPFAGVGLWMLSSWGLVIWALCAVIEILMYGFFSDQFGYKPWLIIANLIIFAVYVTLWGLQYLDEKQNSN